MYRMVNGERVEMTPEEIAERKREEANAPVIVPVAVSPLQARRALREAGLIDAVNTAVDAAGPDARDAWEYAIEVRRDNAMLAGLAAQLGMTEAQLDALFIRAATL